MNIELVVLDMAGTTVRDEKEVESCFAAAARQTGLVVSDERITAVQGMAKRYVFELLWQEQTGQPIAALQAQVDESYRVFRTILEEHYRTQPIEPTEGCLATLAWLRQHQVRIALTTGFYREVTDIILGRLGWLEGLDNQRVRTSGSVSPIDVSIASDEVSQGRPAPLLIQRAMELLGVTDPRRVVNVEDTPSDLLSGAAAGCQLNVGLTNGTHTKTQLHAYPHDRLLDSLADLPAVLAPLLTPMPAPFSTSSTL